MQNLLFSKNQIIRRVVVNAFDLYNSTVEVLICERDKFGVTFCKTNTKLNWFSKRQERATIEAVNMLTLREACKILKANNIAFKLVKKHGTGCLGYLGLYLVIERF